MGYTTKFKGKITVEPPMDMPLYAKIGDIYEDSDQHAQDSPVRGYCQWEATRDGAGLQWDGGEKFYDAAEWMNYLVKKVIAPTGRVCNGTINASGEERGDIWQLIVRDNRVYTKRIDRKVIEQVIETEGDLQEVGP